MRTDLGRISEGYRPVIRADAEQRAHGLRSARTSIGSPPSKDAVMRATRNGHATFLLDEVKRIAGLRKDVRDREPTSFPTAYHETEKRERMPVRMARA